MKTIDCEPNCELQDISGPLRFAGIFYESGDVLLANYEGGRSEVHIDQIWRIEGLLARLSPEDAFRIGIEWGRWSWPRRVAHSVEEMHSP